MWLFPSTITNKWYVEVELRTVLLSNVRLSSGKSQAVDNDDENKLDNNHISIGMEGEGGLFSVT